MLKKVRKYESDKLKVKICVFDRINSNMDINTARKYLKYKLAILPANRLQKRPVVSSWKEFQRRLPTSVEIDAWFFKVEAGCVDLDEQFFANAGGGQLAALLTDLHVVRQGDAGDLTCAGTIPIAGNNCEYYHHGHGQP